ncbi:MAG: tetratricopeptide repeat protein [Ktedonobacteraceae bacterium]|nr:tetratricopeptide repeat protein [Ktedonobacteraceae bacterium]
MDAATEKLWAERAVRAINAAFPDVEHKMWPLCERLLTHALLAAEWIEKYQFIFPAASRLLNQTGVYLYERARYGEAEPLYRRALRIREEQLGGEHPETARSLNNLAELYRVQGKYEEAEPLYRRALKIFKQKLGGEHPNTLVVQRNYARLLRAMGRDEEAVEVEGNRPPG